MFTGRVLFNDFILSTLLFSLMMWLSVALPFQLWLDWSWPSSLASVVVILGLVSIWMYLFHFKLQLDPVHFVIQSALGLLGFSLFTIHPDLFLKKFGDEVHRPNEWFEYIGLIYSVIVLTTSFICGWICSRTHQLPTINNQHEPCKWLSADIDLNNMTYGSPAGMARLRSLFVVFFLIGVILVFGVIIPKSEVNQQGFQLLALRVFPMGLSLILLTNFGVSLAEASRLIQLERNLGRGSFKLLDFDERLKWRHDYVKHHLPAPIRKLNLRLFNQHVEAYERLQKEIKTSRT